LRRKVASPTLIAQCCNRPEQEFQGYRRRCGTRTWYAAE
jgi:hypothetical protein